MFSMSSFALFDEIDDVCVFLSTPTLDGVIEKADGWSDPVVLNNDTIVTVSHSEIDIAIVGRNELLLNLASNRRERLGSSGLDVNLLDLDRANNAS